MSAILKLKSDGAQALLTAALLVGCALNVMLVLAFVGRSAHGFSDTVAVSARSNAAPPVVAGSAGPAPHRAPADVVTTARPVFARAQRAS